MSNTDELIESARANGYNMAKLDLLDILAKYKDMGYALESPNLKRSLATLADELEASYKMRSVTGFAVTHSYLGVS